MENIYLLAKGGYWEATIENFYVSTVEDIEKVLAWYHNEYFFEDIKDVEVDFESLTVKYKANDEYARDNWENLEYNLIRLQKLE